MDDKDRNKFEECTDCTNQGIACETCEYASKFCGESVIVEVS